MPRNPEKRGFGAGFASTFQPTMDDTMRAALKYILEKPQRDLQMQLGQEQLAGAELATADKTNEYSLGPQRRELEMKKLGADVSAQEALAAQRQAAAKYKPLSELAKENITLFKEAQDFVAKNYRAEYEDPVLGAQKVRDVYEIFKLRDTNKIPKPKAPAALAKKNTTASDVASDFGFGK